MKHEFVVLPGDGIGPEISEATIQVLEVLNRKLSLGITLRDPRDRPLSAGEGRLDLPRRGAGGGAGGRRHHPRAGLALGLSRRATRAASTARRICGCSSTSTPTSARAARARGWRITAGRRSTSSSCARTPRASTPTAPCSWAPASIMPTPDVAIAMRKVTAKGSRAHRQGRLRARAHPGAPEADLRAQGQRVEDLGRALPQGVPGGRGGLSGYRRRRPADRLDDGDAGARRAAVRRDRHHQHVRRHPLGPGVGTVGQPRARRRDQRRRRRTAWRRRSTARRPTSRARTRRTRARWCCRRRCCSTGSRTSAGFPTSAVARRRSTAPSTTLVKDPETRTRDLGGKLGTRAFTRDALRRDRAEPLRWRCGSAPTCRFLFAELPLLDRFEAAAEAGFQGRGAARALRGAGEGDPRSGWTTPD